MYSLEDAIQPIPTLVMCKLMARSVDGPISAQYLMDRISIYPSTMPLVLGTLVSGAVSVIKDILIKVNSVDICNAYDSDMK